MRYMYEKKRDFIWRRKDVDGDMFKKVIKHYKNTYNIDVDIIDKNVTDYSYPVYTLKLIGDIKDLRRLLSGPEVGLVQRSVNDVLAKREL